MIFYTIDLMNHFYKSKFIVGKHQKIQGLENIDKIIGIDQSPIGRTPRSNAITYVNAFNKIRELFSSIQESKGKRIQARKIFF